MFRFHRIHDHASETERREVAEVQAIFRRAFPDTAGGAEKIARYLEERGRLGFDVLLLVAEDERGRILAFALVHLYAPLAVGYLDFIATDPEVRARGVGGALYEALRELLLLKGARGLLMEVPPDQPELVKAPERLALNKQRLKFYERYGAYPIEGTLYQVPPEPEPGYDPPHLVLDPLGRPETLPRDVARKAVRAIFELKYGWDPDDAYVRRVVESFRDDPIRLRKPRYVVREPRTAVDHGRLKPIKLLLSARHELHHVRERGYVERPVRIGALLEGIAELPIEKVAVRRHGEAPIRAVHDGGFVSYLQAVCETLPPGRSLYPYVFPIRRPDRKPRDRAVRAGYYCIDTFTPLSRNAWVAARAAVDCALTGAELIERGERLAYAVCRPPGHHAERRVFGGFCYFNNAAIAAHRLSAGGKVALLDVDYHHGNGSQDIFWERSDVLFVSLHGHPNHSYPYFSGFADERGEGAGLGFNRNYPLPEGIGDERYLATLREALEEIARFAPRALVVSVGYDVMRGDPTGSFTLTAGGMEAIGAAIGALRLPTLLVQEGGYLLRNLGRGARAFLTGLARMGT